MAAEAQPVGLTGGCQCGAVRYRLDAAPTGELDSVDSAGFAPVVEACTL